MNDRKQGERAIDYVRRKIAEAKKYCTTDTQIQNIERLLELLNKNDYVFIDLTVNNAFEIFRVTRVSTAEAAALYKEMVNPEECKEYRQYKAQMPSLIWKARDTNLFIKLKELIFMFAGPILTFLFFAGLFVCIILAMVSWGWISSEDAIMVLVEGSLPFFVSWMKRLDV